MQLVGVRVYLRSDEHRTKPKQSAPETRPLPQIMPRYFLRDATEDTYYPYGWYTSPKYRPSPYRYGPVDLNGDMAKILANAKRANERRTTRAAAALRPGRSTYGTNWWKAEEKLRTRYPTQLTPVVYTTFGGARSRVPVRVVRIREEIHY